MSLTGTWDIKHSRNGAESDLRKEKNKRTNYRLRVPDQQSLPVMANHSSVRKCQISAPQEYFLRSGCSTWRTWVLSQERASESSDQPFWPDAPWTPCVCMLTSFTAGQSHQESTHGDISSLKVSFFFLTFWQKQYYIWSILKSSWISITLSQTMSYRGSLRLRWFLTYMIWITARIITDISIKCCGCLQIHWGHAGDVELL